MSDVLCFGSLNLDLVYSVPAVVSAGQTLAASDRAVHVGGKGLNQSIALARAGCKVRHAGVVGADGAPLLAALREAGVDTSCVRTDPDRPSGHAVIQVSDNGSNAIVVYPGTNATIGPDDIEAAFEGVAPGSTVILQNEINAIETIVERAIALDLKIVFNPSPMTPTLLTLPLDRFDCLLVNEHEARELLASDDKLSDEAVLEQLHARWPDVTIVMTLGDKGALFVSPCEGVARVNARLVVAIDTTAAGDTFTGYFVAARLQGRSLHECVERGCLAASIAVTRAGAAPSIPTRDEVDALNGEFHHDNQTLA